MSQRIENSTCLPRARAFHETADDQPRRDDRERELEHREHRFGNRAADRADLDAGVPHLRQPADEAAAEVERERIAEHDPNQRDHAAEREHCISTDKTLRARTSPP